MYIFDTDHLGVLQRAAGSEFRALSERIAKHLQTDFYVTIISFHEQILGWHSYINKAKDQQAIVRGYARLERILADFNNAQVLPFDEAAAEVFDRLRAEGVRIGTMDLRIASIAISRDMTLLTRNLVDFRRVPALRAEDWTA